MSLLMEALRKAEEAKRKIQNPHVDLPTNSAVDPASHPDIAPVPVVTASVDTEFTLEDIDLEVTADYIADNFLGKSPDARNPEFPFRSASGKPSRASVEELQNYLETTHEIEEPAPDPRATTRVTNSSTAQQRAAGSVFAAKQKPSQSHSTRNMLLVLLALLIPVGAGIIWYLVNSTDSSMMFDPALINADLAHRSLSDELIIAQPEPSSPNQAPAVTEVVRQEIQQAPATTARTTVAPNPANEPAQVAISTPTPNTASTTIASPAPAASAPIMNITNASETTTDVATQPSASSVGGAADGDTSTSTVLEVSHSTGASKNNQPLLDAYASLQAGDFANASALYEQVLQQLPNNRDALLGSAAITLRNGDITKARELYSRLMQLNPKDPLARTGLLQTIQDIDAVQYELELRRLLQQFPDVAPLSFALGNAYASQQRWNEAQSAYFDAFLFARQSNESAINPDYAYNLAVSLEQIDQPVAALDYYRQAQTLASAFTPGFDMQALSRRISFLEQNRP